jgi:hypothetical protein
MDSWVSSRYVFLIKVLIIQPNTTCRCSTVLFYYTLQHVAAVHISHHQEDVGDTKIDIKGERPLVTVL